MTTATARHTGPAADLAVGRSYREATRDFAQMRTLDLWYARIDTASGRGLGGEDVVATGSRGWFRDPDSYGIEVRAGEYASARSIVTNYPARPLATSVCGWVACRAVGRVIPSG
jgi:hypothetical protein